MSAAAQLKAFLQQGSPETFALIEQAGALELHLADIVRQLDEKGAIRDGAILPDRVPEAYQLVGRIVAGPVADAVAASQVLSSDPERWTGELQQWLERSSPEAFLTAREQGVVPRQVQEAVDAGRARMEAKLRLGQPREAAVVDARAYIVRFATGTLGAVDVLDRMFRESSPQQHAIAERLGVLAEHLERVAEWLRSNGAIDGDQIRPDRVADARQHVIRIDDSPVAEAVRASQILGDDPDRWRAELDRHLATNGPESYAEARRLGRLDLHLGIVVAAGLRARAERQENGAPVSVALAHAKRVMLRRATPILPTPVELRESVRQVRTLTVNDLAAADEWFQISPPETQATIARALMEAVMESQDFGRLLDHPVFASRFGDGILHQFVLGARHFGRDRLSEALEVFAALEGRCGTPLAFLCHGNCLRALGDLPAALAVMRRAMAAHPEDQECRLAAASLSFALGDSAGANAILEPIREQYFADFPRQDYMAERQAELDVAIRDGLHYRAAEKDVYDDKFSEATWWNYWFHFNGFSQRQHAEGILAEMVPHHVDATLRRLERPARSFVELGTMCGELIYRIARAHPDLPCYGVDRQVRVKQLNDLAYRLPSLRFVADDLFSFLGKQPAAWSDAMLFHVRTAPFLYPAFLQDLYARCGQLGFRYVALLEAYPMSYAHRRFQTFEEMEEVAEIRHSALIHHNYPRILKNAGFRVIEQTVTVPSMLFAQPRDSVYIVAERID